MCFSNLRQVKSIAVALGLLLVSTATYACRIVYGSDWAFVLEPPKGWEVVCGNQTLEGTAVTLWPANSGPQEAQSLIYVTVSQKDPTPLQAFANDEQTRYQAQQESVRVSPLKLPFQKAKFAVLAFQLSQKPPARQELIAYIEGPTAYFILVLTSADNDELERHRKDFFTALKFFIPMKRK